MLKQIIFRTLQRFNSKDANELQSGVIKKINALTHMVSPLRNNGAGAGATFPVSKMSIASVSYGQVLPIGPVVVIGSKTNEVFVVDQEAIDAGQLVWDFTAAFNDFVVAKARGQNPSGLHFYGYPIVEEADNESREFYNTVDGTPYNQDVFTRRVNKFETFVSTDLVFNIPNDAGVFPVKFFYWDAADIDETANIEGGQVMRPQDVKCNSAWQDVFLNETDFDDSTLPNVANGRATALEGSNRYGQNFNYSTSTDPNDITWLFKRLERHVSRIVGMGSSDPADTDLIPFGRKPIHSLQGLRKRQEALETRATALENRTLSASITYRGQFDQSAGSWTIDFITDNPTDGGQNEFDLTGFVDFHYAKQNHSISAQAISGLNSAQWQYILGNIALQVPVAYAGARIVSWGYEIFESDTGGNITTAAGRNIGLNNEMPTVIRETTSFEGITITNRVGTILTRDASDAVASINGLKCFIVPNNLFRSYSSDTTIMVKLNLQIQEF